MFLFTFYQSVTFSENFRIKVQRRKKSSEEERFNLNSDLLHVKIEFDFLMGKIRKEKLGDKANEYNFFDVTYQNNGLMQPIQQEEKTTRSGKIFSPEKLIQSREEIKKGNSSVSSSKSSPNLDSSSEEQDGFKVTLSAVIPKSKNDCSNFKGFSTATETKVWIL